MSRATQGARIGTAAFALGLSLAGPQAVGVASADSGDSGGSASASSSAARSADAAPRGGGRQARAGVRAPAVSPTAASAITPAQSDRGADSASDSAPARPVVRGRDGGGPAPAAAVRRPGAGAARPAAVGPSVAAPPGSTPAVAASPTSTPSVAVQVARVPAPAATSVAEVSGAAAVAGAAQPPAWARAITDAVAQGQQARPAVAAAVGSIRAALNAGVNTVFDTLANVLSRLPFTDALSGALLLVRRSLFDQLPPNEGFTDVLKANGQWAGSLNPADWSETGLTYAITDAPDHGSVQINTDGTYLYTPDNGYTGPDSFTVNTTDPGFNLLDPSGPRTLAVTATVNTADTFTYPSIKNIGDDTYLHTESTSIFRDGPGKGLETVVRPYGPLLKPGDTWFIQYPGSYATPAPGVFFKYKVKVFVSKPRRDLLSIDFTQEEGSSKTSVKIDELNGWELNSVTDEGVPTRGDYYNVLDLNGPGFFSNSSKRVEIAPHTRSSGS